MPKPETVVVPRGESIETPSISAGPGDIVCLYADGHMDIVHSVPAAERGEVLRSFHLLRVRGLRRRGLRLA